MAIFKAIICDERSRLPQRPRALTGTAAIDADQHRKGLEFVSAAATFKLSDPVAASWESAEVTS